MHKSLKRLLTSTPATGTELFMKQSQYAGKQPDAGIDMRVKYAGKRQGASLQPKRKDPAG